MPRRSAAKPPELPPDGRRLVRWWSAGLVSLFLLAGLVTVPTQYKARRDSAVRHRARMYPQLADDEQLPPGARPVRVTAGMYVDRIIELSVKDVGWMVDFYVWFRWRPAEAHPDINPGEQFQVVDGAIESRQLEVDTLIGEERYQRYRVVARITKLFEITRFPRDSHLLTISLETPAHIRGDLLFVPDEAATGISSRVAISAYEIQRTALVEKPHAYRTTRGDPRLPPGARAVHSQLTYGIWIRRPGGGLYFKMFQALFVAVVLAMLAFFVKPTDVDPRFGLGIGALFAAVANMYVTSGLLPETGVMTLADVVNGLGIGVILLTVAESTLSLYLFDRRGQEALSRRLDRVSFAIIFAGYVLLNVALPIAAG